MFKRLFLFCICSLLLVQSIGSATSAINVVDEVKNTVAVSREEARAIAEQARVAAEIAEAAAAVAKDEAELAKSEADKAAAEEAAIVAKASVKQAEETAQKAVVKAEEKKQAAEIAEANEAAAKAKVAFANDALKKAKIAEAKAAEAAAAEVRAAEAEAEAQAASAAATAVKAAGDNEAKMDQEIAAAEAAADRAYAIASAKTIAAERRANDAVAAVEAAEMRLAVAEEQVESSADARAEAIDVAAAAADAQRELMDAKVAAEELRKELAAAKEDLNLAKADLVDSRAAFAEAKKQMEPVLKRRSIQLESQYFSWQDNQGHSGYQFYQPYEFNYVNKNTEIGLRTSYVISENKSAAGGRISTWTDTVLSLAQKNQKNKYSVRYSLDINLPTGKSKLNGTNAIMSDDLVGLSRFGEGWNYTPGVSVSRKIGKEDTWTLETHYSFRGNYTYDGSIPNGQIYPGNEWAKTLRWLHAGQKWQLVGELTHTNFGVTKEGDIDYREGSQFDAKLNYSRDLSQDQNLMLYYWHSTEKPYSSSDPVAAGIDGTSTLNRQYFGGAWSKSLPNNRTFRIMANMMHSSGDTYNPLTNLTVNGRSKYSGGLGYDINLAPEKRLSLDIERFYMKDDSPGTSYHGYNIYVRYFADL